MNDEEERRSIMVKLTTNTALMRRRQVKSKLFSYIAFASIVFCFVALIWLFWSIAVDAFGWLNWSFIVNFPSRFPHLAGMFPGIIGSLILVVLIALIAIPVGLGSAIYLEEYANKKTRYYRWIDISIANLSGIPSIIYGVLGLGIFSYFTIFKGTIAGAALILALLVLPVVITSSREALKAVPRSLKEAAYGLGMTKWQMLVAISLPYAMPGILTGVILALSRAIGEGAPLIVVGAATIVTSLPSSLSSSFTAMPILVYYWAGLPQEAFQHVAAAGSVVLIIVLLIFNSVAIIMRNKFQRRG